MSSADPSPPILARKRGAPKAADLSYAERLAAIPVRNQRVEAVELQDAATLTVPLSYGPVLRPLASLLKLRRTKSYRLDGLGLEVWRKVDGVATVESLVDWLAQEHRLSFHEARVLMTMYLQMLMERGLVVVAGRTGAGLPERL